jgi:hypothetical protein
MRLWLLAGNRTLVTYDLLHAQSRGSLLVGPGDTLALVGLVFVYQLRVLLFVPPVDCMPVEVTSRTHPCVLQGSTNMQKAQLGIMIQNGHYRGVQLPNHLHGGDRTKNRLLGTSKRKPWTLQRLYNSSQTDVCLGKCAPCEALLNASPNGSPI